MTSLNNLLALVKTRLEANGRLLLLLPPGGEQLNATAARQQHVFDAALRAMPMMPESVAVDLCEEVARVGWPSHDAQVAAIMDHISPPAELRLFGQQVTSRTQLQNYVHIEHHVPDRIWNGSREQFTAHVCEFICVDMGLQNASESTVQKMVALSLLVTHGGRNGATSTSWGNKRSATSVPGTRRMDRDVACRPGLVSGTVPRTMEPVAGTW